MSLTPGRLYKVKCGSALFLGLISSDTLHHDDILLEESEIFLSLGKTKKEIELVLYKTNKYYVQQSDSFIENAVEELFESNI